jgi:hypothetical protein
MSACGQPLNIFSVNAAPSAFLPTTFFRKRANIKSGRTFSPSAFYGMNLNLYQARLQTPQTKIITICFAPLFLKLFQSILYTTAFRLRKRTQ